MKIKQFKESEIRKAVIDKAKPIINSRRSKHDKGLIYLDGQIVARVKIPNHHARIMQPSKSKYIAENLKLGESEFNNFVECSLTRKKYLFHLKNQNLN